MTVLGPSQAGSRTSSGAAACAKPAFTFRGASLRAATPAQRAAERSAPTRGPSPAKGLNSAGSTVATLPRSAPAVERSAPRLALPSKGRMAEDAMDLLRDCQLSVVKPNPRQYVAKVAQLPGLEVWFQRASDVVRKVALGDVDLGIVGYDMVSELCGDSDEVLVVHDALGFGACRLALGVPATPRWSGVSSIDDLRALPWTPDHPLRVVTGYRGVAERFFRDAGFEHVALLSADGALEAAPAMGTADIILDLVSSGVTLRENNLREIEGGRVLESQGVLIANRRALQERPATLLPLVRELLERLDAHLTAERFYSVVANMRGRSEREVADLLLSSEKLRGLQGPTISPVYTKEGAAAADPAAASDGPGFFAAQICVPRNKLYPAVKEIRRLGGSGVLTLPITYIFNEETVKWHELLDKLGLDEDDVPPAV